MKNGVSYEVVVNIQKTISAGHFVHSDEESKCAKLHGHNWDIEVEICGLVGEDGMVIDKKEIDEYLNQLDHMTLVPEEVVTEDTMGTVRVEHNEKEYELPKEDVLIIGSVDFITSELLAKELADRIHRMRENIEGVAVNIHESDKLSVTAVAGEYRL